MKRLASLLALAATLLLMFVAAAAAESRIEVTATLDRADATARAPAGRRGDVTSSAWTVRDRHARRIGEMLLDCRWVRTTELFCVGEIALPLGTLIVAGSSPNLIQGQYAVTGGTRRYRAAAGEMLFRATSTRRVVLSIALE